MSRKQEEFQERTEHLDRLLGIGRSFDMVGRNLLIGGRHARFWVVNGYMEDGLVERVIDRWLAVRDLPSTLTAADFVARCISVGDAQTETDESKALTAVFSGKALLVLEGLPENILLDVKTYPARSVAEPDNSKVLRGAHDGFL